MWQGAERVGCPFAGLFSQSLSIAMVLSTNGVVKWLRQAGDYMTDENEQETVKPIDEPGRAPLTMEEEDSQEERLAEHARRVATSGDDEDDTWTNQPAAADQGELEEGLDDHEDEEPESSPAPRKAIETARDVVCEELPYRAQRAAARLKPFLTGTFIFDFTNSGEKFLFDWRGDVPVTKPLPRGLTISCDESQGFVSTDTSINVDTVVLVSEQHLMAVRSGSLNPQVGMLTEKIRVKGKVGPAVYIFNVVAPRVRS
jgi:hypothetical protein